MSAVFNCLVNNADNFVGVIAPNATEAILNTRSVTTSLQAGIQKTALSGGVVVRNQATSTVRAMSATKQSVEAGVGAGEVSLSLKIPLSKLEANASRMKPIGAALEAGFEITGLLSNLKLTQSHDFGWTGLKTFDMKLSGDIKIETKLTGSGEVNLGYFSQAWKEVEESQAKLLGFSAKLTGLDSKDKIGKFPLAGLVWSTPCATSCPVVVGSTQTPLRSASSGGVIIWIYLTANGTIVLEGSTGARVNPSTFSMGVSKKSGGDFEGVSDMQRLNSGRMIEVPFVEGSANLKTQMGVSLDMDSFISGVRAANASMNIVGRSNTNIKGNISYGTDNYGEPWGFVGNVCLSSNIGAGVIFSANVNLGVSVDTDWTGEASLEGSYHAQWPSEEEITIPGWHGIKNKTWYTSETKNLCFPQPVLTSVTTAASGETATIVVSGKNLPDDMRLVVTPSTRCTGVQPTATKSAEQIIYSCTLANAGMLSYSFESDMAENINTTSVAGASYQYAGRQPPVISTIADPGKGDPFIGGTAMTICTSGVQYTMPSYINQKNLIIPNPGETDGAGCTGIGGVVGFEFGFPSSMYAVIGRAVGQAEVDAAPTGRITVEYDGKICVQPVAAATGTNSGRGTLVANTWLSQGRCDLQIGSINAKAPLKVKYSGDDKHSSFEWSGFYDSRINSSNLISIDQVNYKSPNLYEVVVKVKSGVYGWPSGSVALKADSCGNNALQGTARIPAGSGAGSVSVVFLWNRPAGFVNIPIPQDFVAELLEGDPIYYPGTTLRANARAMATGSCAIGSWKNINMIN